MHISDFSLQWKPLLKEFRPIKNILQGGLEICPVNKRMHKLRKDVRLTLRVSMLRWRFMIFVYSFSDDVSRFTTLWLKFVASVDDRWSFWLRSSGDCLFIYFQPRKGVAKSPQQNTQTAQNSVTSAFDRQWILHRFVLINVKCRL